MSKAVRLNPNQFALWEEERRKGPTETVFNPTTGQPIRLGGPTYLKIEQVYQKMINVKFKNKYSHPSKKKDLTNYQKY